MTEATRPVSAAEPEIVAGLVAAFGASRRVLLVGHERPDPDCFGAQLGLAYCLRQAGKEVRIANPDPLPRRFHFLADEELLRAYIPGEDLSGFDLVVVLDAAAEARLGGLAPALPPQAQTVNIDHHKTNWCRARLSWIDPQASSSSELVYVLVQRAGWPLTLRAAEALYAGIYMDTGGFSYANTTPRALRIAAELLERGVAPERMWRRLLLNRSPAELALEVRAAQSLALHAGGRIATVCLSAKDFAETGLGPQDTQEIAGIPRRLAGVEVAAFLYDLAGGVKVSIRTSEAVDATVLAGAFGGGGHARAAGCHLKGVSLPRALEIFLQQAAALLPPNQA